MNEAIQVSGLTKTYHGKVLVNQLSLPAFLGSWLLTMISTLSIGILVGGVAKYSKQAGVIAFILYFPMLVFSGTTLPIEVMPGPMLPILVMLGVTVICAGAAIRFFKWE